MKRHTDVREIELSYEQRRRGLNSSAGIARVHRKLRVHCAELAGDTVTGIIYEVPGNHAPTGSVKVSTASGWFAARPSGTEDIYRIHAESFCGKGALDRIVDQAQTILDRAIGSGEEQ